MGVIDLLKIKKIFLSYLYKNLSLLGVLLLLCTYFSLASPQFLTISNLFNTIMQSSVMGIVAIGVTFIVLIGGIDLSPGSAVALVGVLSAGMVTQGFPVGVVILVAVFLGGAIGFFNGISVAKLGLSPFITTLAVMSMGRGLAMAFTNGKTIYNLPDSFNFMGNGLILGIPFPVILTGALFIIAHIVLSRTVFGHQIYSIGGNREAAYLAGIDVRKVEIIVYSLAGCLYGIASMVLTGRLGVALPTIGTGLEMNALAAIVLGGASLYGGKGNMVGTLIGVIIIGVLNNGLNLLNVSPYWTLFIQGFVIFIALLIDAINQNKVNFKSRNSSPY